MNFKASRDTLDLGLKIIAITIDNIDIFKNNKKFIEFKKNAYEALKKKYQNFDIETDLILKGIHNIHKKIGIKRHKNTPINEQILKKFLKNEKFNTENKLMHLYYIVILDSRLPIFIYDKDKIGNNIILKLAENGEKYISKTGEEKKLIKGEYIYKSENEIIQKLETEQNPKTLITKNTKNILIIIEGSEATSFEYLMEVASEIIDLINTYCLGTAKIIYNK